MGINEWANDDPRGPLGVPAERLATQRYKWVAQKDMGLNGTCADYELQLHAVKLTDVLIDTSERFQSTVLKRRVTHRPELVLAQTAVVIFPLHHDEPSVP